jgi:chemotaxis protein MotA
VDPGTIIGLVLALIGIFLGVILEGASPAVMLLIPSMLIVFGGTFGAGLAGMTMADGINSLKGLKIAFLSKKVDSGAVVPTIVTLADKARREGLLALEDAMKQVDDPFLKRGLELAIDGTDPEELREILEGEIDATRKDYNAKAKLWADMGGYAPTIGIIGTVFGLVLVLENLDKPEELGHKIAAAFIATLWGVFAANVWFLPWGSKIKRVSELEVARMELVLEGIMAIQAGSNPRTIERRLRSLLPPGSAAPDEKKKAA